MRKFFDEFRAFATRGNVLDLAIGVMIGGAFGKIIASLVNDIFMPLIGLVLGGLDFGNLFIALDGKNYPSAQVAIEAGAGILNIGAFLSSMIDFMLIALCIFLVLRLINKVVRKKSEPAKPAARRCPYCYGELHQDATRCPYCTSQLVR